MDDEAAAPAPARGWPPLVLLAGSAAVTLALLGTVGSQARQRSIDRATAIAAYDLDAALDLAGRHVPAETESFYFFVLQPDGDERDELAAKLVQAAGEHEFLGIAGADADHNRAILRAALALVSGQSLAGLIIIYVGPAEHEAELAPLVGASGAELRFVTYLPPPAETI